MEIFSYYDFPIPFKTRPKSFYKTLLKPNPKHDQLGLRYEENHLNRIKLFCRICTISALNRFHKKKADQKFGQLANIFSKQ